MKQILQDLGTGVTSLIDAPSPQVKAGHLIINTVTSLISAGTERSLVEFGKASYLAKARQQPEKVRMVLDKVQTDGLIPTIEAVRAKLDQPLPLGYCNVGVISEVGSGVDGFKLGDRIASNGPHAEVVRVPKNLCARIPDAVTDEEAAFTVVASIGLQGIRLANVELGESVVVIGAGLIGLLTIQLLRAQGCRVLAIDPDESKLVLARQFGAEACNPGRGEDPLAIAMGFSRGHGVDAVIITASTKSSDPVSQAARMSRKRGRIVLVGVTGLELNRADFYEKELSFQVSCSYGPGRYDPVYEEQGHDYPFGFVRWTQKRNFEAVLDLIACGRLDVKPLISHRFNFNDASQAYERLSNDRAALGILLKYSSAPEVSRVRTVELDANARFDPHKPVLGFIGAGNYASRVLIPAFKHAGAQLHSISASGGVNGVIHGEKAGFAHATTDTQALINSKSINTLIVATRHDSHASLVEAGLLAGKHVFVEKPLAMSEEEVDKIEGAYRRRSLADTPPLLMVGFNRRFSPQIQKMKMLLTPIPEPKSFIMTVNAGAIPADHWTQDPLVGGGRIIGEACHFIDLMRFLAGSGIVSVQARRMGDNSLTEVTEDKAALILGFKDGSFGTINYLANGASSFPKERIEVFCAGRILQLDNFRKLRAYGWPGFKGMSLWRQDKGQSACAAAFIQAISGGLPSPIPAEEIFEVARATLEATDILRAQ